MEKRTEQPYIIDFGDRSRCLTHPTMTDQVFITGGVHTAKLTSILDATNLLNQTNGYSDGNSNLFIGDKYPILHNWIRKFGLVNKTPTVIIDVIVQYSRSPAIYTRFEDSIPTKETSHGFTILPFHSLTADTLVIFGGFFSNNVYQCEIRSIGGEKFTQLPTKLWNVPNRKWGFHSFGFTTIEHRHNYLIIIAGGFHRRRSDTIYFTILNSNKIASLMNNEPESNKRNIWNISSMKLPKPVSHVSLAVTNGENNNNNNPLIHILGGMNNEYTQENTHLTIRVQEILGSTVFEKEWSSGHICVKKRLERAFDNKLKWLAKNIRTDTPECPVLHFVCA